jgi:transcriptional regulator with XRE-family HTH domain
LFIKEWRKSRGLTQVQLANRLGVESATVSRWESPTSPQKARPNDQVMAAIAESLGIEPEDLYHHPDKPTPNQLLRDVDRATREQAMRWLEAIVGGRKAS